MTVRLCGGIPSAHLSLHICVAHMSNSSTNVRAALDEARLNELLRKAQDSFLEIKAEKEALAKEQQRLTLLDAVLAERKALLDQREAGIKKQENVLAERESRVQRAEADLTSNASFLNKLRATKESGTRTQDEDDPASASTVVSVPTNGAKPALAGAKPALARPALPPLSKLPPLPPLKKLPPLLKRSE